MTISRKIADPAGIVNASGQPEIVIELDGLVLSMKPPAAEPADPADQNPAPPDDPAGDD